MVYPQDKVILDDLQFSEDLFFHAILPLIVFPKGYNMRRKKFFQNIGAILKFGVVGTLLCFMLNSTMLIAALKTGWITKYDAKTDKQVSLDNSLGTFEILSLCSLLCSSDFT